MEASHLRSQETFRLLRPEQLDAISSVAEEVSLRTGDVVFRRGEPAKDFYVVLEGQVALRLPRPDGVSVLIDDVQQGAIFGSCLCFQLDEYTLSASCTRDSRLLKIDAATLKRLMDEDLFLGNAIQTLISRIYFKRYIDTMSKLQWVIQSIPLEVAQGQR